MKLTIENYKCLSWNEFNRNMHWSIRTAVREELKSLVYAEMCKHRGVKIDKTVDVDITAYFKDWRRRDLDNLFIKPILDGIVDSGLIRDDNGDVIDSLTLRAKVRQPQNKIIIKINENEKKDKKSNN
jgi:Holliday junction resolvase RusA-like endonuclease